MSKRLTELTFFFIFGPAEHRQLARPVFMRKLYLNMFIIENLPTKPYSCQQNIGRLQDVYDVRLNLESDKNLTSGQLAVKQLSFKVFQE